MKNKTNILLVIGTIIFIGTLFLLQLPILEEVDFMGTSINQFLKSPTLKLLLTIVTNIMSAIGVIIIFGFTVFLLRKKQAKKEIITYSVLITGTLLIVNLIKIIIKRTRPLNQLLTVTGYSFPSAHATLSMVIYGYLILLIRKNYQGKHKNLYILLCIFMILLTGFSRIYFNVHYITDVLAGFGLGLILLCLSNIYLKHLTNPLK